MATQNNTQRLTAKEGRAASGERALTAYTERQLESYFLAKDTVRRIQRTSYLGLPSRSVAPRQQS